MRFNLRIEADAREEIRVAGDWYESREPGLGGRFAGAIDDSVARIVSNPFRFRQFSPTTRKAKVIGWPYSIYFTILEDRHLVKVVAVWQENQNPARLHLRLK